ncbi:MAG: DUF808 family protein, partial [Boseongicola sp.]|nr:DUF808 family protein [Boseongicola sp.]
LVKSMPTVMTTIAVIGTAAMLWVGGNIIVHGLEVLGWHWPYDTIHAIAVSVSASVSAAQGFVEWLVTAFLDGVLGLALGLALMPVVNRAIAPTFARLFPEKQDAAPY